MQHKPKFKASLAMSMIGICFAGQAVAQTNVSVYGVLDTFLTNIRADGVPSTYRVDSSGLLASRIGFKGTEDLGNGYRANFVIENGLNANDGSAADANRLFNRQAWVGLASPYGEVRLGRQNTPQFYMNGRFDAFEGATQASGWNNFFSAAMRTDNTIGYFSPVMGGLTLQALVARGAVGGAPTTALVVADNQSFNFAAEYQSGPVYVGLNYQDVKALGAAETKRTGLGASYTFNEYWKLFADADHESKSDGSQDINMYSLSGSYSFTPASVVSVGWAGMEDKLNGAGHGNAAELSAQYRYSLSKRTRLYGAVSHMTQSDLRKSFSLNGAYVVEAGAQVRSTVPGGTIDGVQLGICYTF